MSSLPVAKGISKPSTGVDVEIVDRAERRHKRYASQIERPLTTEKSISADCGFDNPSAIGRFTWETFGDDKYIPVLFRNEEKFVSARMAEISVIGEWLSVLPVDLYESIKISAFYATSAEANVLTHINSWHCDGFYGPEKFTQFDLLISLDNLKKFHDFLHFGFSVLHSGGKNIDSEFKHCGFVRVDSELLPYTVLESDEPGVPLFYFDGQTEEFKSKAQSLHGWSLAYMKICCKVQGVCKDLTSNPTLLIITLTDLVHYLPKSTTFTERCWPQPKPKSLLPKEMLNAIITSPLHEMTSHKWTSIEVNETCPNYRPSPSSSASISVVVVSSKNGNSSSVMLRVNGVNTKRNIPKEVQRGAPALARIKISSPPVDKSKVTIIPEYHLSDNGQSGAYDVCLILIENVFMHSINSKCGRYEGYLVLLEELIKALFPAVAVYPTAVSILSSCNIITYLPNSAQIRTLNDFGFRIEVNWQAPLIPAIEVLTAISKLKGLMKLGPTPTQQLSQLSGTATRGASRDSSYSKSSGPLILRYKFK